MPAFGTQSTGGGAALAAQQQALMDDLEKTRRMLLAEGFSPQAADAAARHVLGAGPTLGQTPY